MRFRIIAPRTLQLGKGAPSCVLLASGILTAILLIPSGALAQGGSAEPPRKLPPELSEPARRGEWLYIKNCPLCHIHDREREVTGAWAQTDLRGILDDRPEEAVRALIMQGMPPLGMPGFRYTLDEEDLDDLIAFLKERPEKDYYE